MRFLESFENEMKCMGFSRKTVKAYMSHVSKFLLSSEIADAPSAKSYIAKVAESNPNTGRIAINSLRLFFESVIGEKLGAPYPRRPAGQCWAMPA